MSDIAIHVENLGKRYYIGRSREQHDTLRDAIVAGLRAPLDRLRRRGQPVEGSRAVDATIWALKDVSFEVKQGEVLGVIGRNGAGKSTLLKILSRITEPTEGRAEIRGRVGSLLEVGTGFHPELTGRENVYLSGAILGMHRAEIDRRFDEIVAFAEIEKFLDTPVKRYSSGMYVRLAFAVAAHLDPEILLVDEVLAVGDAVFQRKCLGRMGDVAAGGRTVLFVSHNMAAVGALCSRVAVLHGGELTFLGGARAGVMAYQERSRELSEEVDLRLRRDRTGDGSVRIVSVSVRAGDNSPVIRPMSPLRITVGYEGGEPVAYPHFSVGIYDQNQTGVLFLDSDATGGLPTTLPAVGRVTCMTEPVGLTPRRYLVNVGIYKGGAAWLRLDLVQGAAAFEVVPGDMTGTGWLPPPNFLYLVEHAWWAGE